MEKFPGDDIRNVLVDVYVERVKQDEQWGEQNHPDGTGLRHDDVRAESAKSLNDWLVKEGDLTFRDILYEEVMEAFAESDPELLRAELVQVAAVAVLWIEALDRRK